MADKAVKRKIWKRSRPTTRLVKEVQAVVRAAGYDEELCMSPLLHTLSVVVRKGDDIFNLRLKKDDLAIVEVERLMYQQKKHHIRRVTRHKA